MDTATASSLVSRREGQTTRRSRQRELGMWSAFMLGGTYPASTQASNLRKIVCSLIRLDLWTLDTLKSACFRKHPEVINRGVERYEEFLDAELLTLHVCEDLYEVGFEARLQGYFGRLSVQQLLEYVRDLRTSAYYAELMHWRLVMAHTARSNLRGAQASSDRTAPKYMDWCETYQEYLVQLEADDGDRQQKLKAVEREVRFLRGHVKHAVGSGDLDDATLMQLRRKFEALQDHYPDVHDCIHGNRRNILTYEHVLWWDPDAEQRRVSQLDQAPEHAVEAYTSASPTLSFLVPTISLLSCIPAALAWSHASRQVGNAKDAEFYQLVSSSAMQLLGVVTLIWPTVFHARLGRLSWVLTWILAGSGACFTLLAVPLYLLLPTSWSALSSFGGSVALALVLLQLVHTI
ncbi:hypothetical protein GJ744_009268 [Endocarpon pusillum]|uniref:Uncharacterized protein n=1 Tax=Endocarpon pusillum TaxID=364733 RepID=A0A8H7ANQ8_9EURO|nr:hypothetical protein GJ744_009268 [Endocarpon pusillum]